nr:uncharacterized protein LOC112747036 [Arachis hypogaea]
MTSTDDKRRSSRVRHLTTWIRPSIKKELDAHFRNDKGFKRRCLTNVANRASLRSSKYMGRLTTFIKTMSRLSKSLDRETTLAETFKNTHTLKPVMKITCRGWRPRPSNLSRLGE